MDEKETKCPICDFVFPVAEAPVKAEELPEGSVTGLLDDMKTRIQRLAGITPKESPAGKAGQEVREEPVEREDESAEAVEAEETPEIDEAAEAEEKKQAIRSTLVIPGLTPRDAEPTKPVKQGHKISAADATEGGRGRIYLAVAAVIIVAIVILASWYFFLSRPSSTNPTVDGYFDEWEDSVKYQSYFLSDNDEINFKETSIQYYDRSVFWYFLTGGPLFNASSKASTLITTYALFIDADGDSGTGFSLIGGFGADDFVSISGSSGQRNASLTKLYEFVGTDTRNWSSWEIIDPLTVGTMGDRVETSFHPPSYFNRTYAKFIAVSYEGVSRPSVTLPFSLDPGILLIQQTPIINTNGVITLGQNRPVLQVDIKGYGSAKPIEILRPSLTGISGTYNLGPVNWSESEMAAEKSFLFTVNTTALDYGKSVEASMIPASVVSDYSSVVILGTPAKGYVGGYPSGKAVDGLFKDWTSTVEDTADASVGDDDINITRVGNETAASKTYFYIEVVGKIMNGTLIPVRERIPSPSMPSGVGGDERITGEDVLRIYIDTDPASHKGAPTPVNGTDIRPDLMIEISGRNGIITQQMVKYWTTGWYENYSITVEAALDANMMEVEISLGNLTNATFAVVATDWVGNSDNMSGAFS